ncbi:MAG TPA: carboxypeptidase regulatory-like domain-containing protein [Pseudacidobacterium sp.]|jgi:outer membrane receptor protein involved in Fe transport|nr:carboxypeptidase regulatory-like domain-containing protein [Pseudacidobacterium sp.]
MQYREAVLRFLSSLLLVLGALASPASAQVLYGTITGTITDPSGAAVPNASVQALEINKGVTLQATTDSAGIFRFNNILPGTYKFTISASGFATLETDKFVVEANAVQRLDAKLSTASVIQSVIVTTAPAVLQTDRSDVQTNITSAEIQALPAISSEGKNFQALYKIVPGAGLPMESNSAGGNPQRAMTTNINGQSSQGNTTLIDGVPNAYPWLPNNIAYVPPSDSIETVNIVTNAFDAEQGMVGGAIVNVQTKSGTNQFHGDVHELHTNDQLKALNYFTLPGAKRPLNILNQFGASVGGPIKKDKIFFYGGWESTRQTQAPSGGNPQTVPFSGLLYQTASQNGFFDFRGLQTDKSGNSVHVYDPRTGSANGANRQPISCNGVVDTLCFNQADPASLLMAQLIPSPNVSGASTNNYIDTQKGYFHRNDFDGKVTYVQSDRTNIFGRYSYSGSDIFDPPALGPAGGNATLGGQNGNSFGRVQLVGLGLTHTFTPNFLLDMNGGFTRQRLNAEDVDISTDKAFGLDTLKIPGTNDPTNQLYWGIPAFQFNTFSNLGNANTGNPFVFRDNQFLGSANLTWVRGRHNVRGGIAYTHTMLNHFQPQGGTFQTARGSFSFTGAGAQQVTCTGSSCAATDPPTTLQYASYADFLLGLPDQVGKAVQDTNVIALRWSQWALYARDQWQLTPKLSVNYGMRWEYYPMAYSDFGGARVLDTSTMTVLIGGNGGVPVNDGVSVGHGLFLPRLGVAYRATDKTVIRAGYGITADSNNWRFLRNAYPANTISSFVGSTYSQAGNSAFAPAASLTGLNAVGAYSYLPTGITLIPAPDTSSGRIPLPNGVSTTTVPLNFRRGYIHSYNATVEQELAGFVMNLSYVGSRAIRPLTNMNVNPAPYCLPGTVSCNVTGGQKGRILNAAFGGNWSDVNRLTPFGNNYYDAMQARLTRRLGTGSQVAVIYTWSKTINFEDDEELNSIIWPYPPYLSRNRALAGFDRTHNFQAYGIYELPFGRGKQWATSGITSALFGGWRLSGIFSAMSGTPFTVTDTNAGSFNSPGNTLTPNLVAPIRMLRGRPATSPSQCSSNACKYVDPSSFAHVAIPGVLGSAERNIIRGPGYLNLDMSMNRDFRITERLHFQFEANAFGVTNTPHFNTPTSDINSSNFGKITSTLAVTNASLGGSGGERQWWFGGKVTF